MQRLQVPSRPCVVPGVKSLAKGVVLNSTAHPISTDSRMAGLYNDGHVELCSHSAEKSYSQQGSRIGPRLELDARTGKYLEDAHSSPLVANRDISRSKPAGSPTRPGSPTDNPTVCEPTHIWCLNPLAPSDNSRD